MGVGYNDIKNMKDDVLKHSKRGFWYFMKNVTLFILLFLVIFIFMNPSVMGDPVHFFSNFNINSIWGVFVSLIMIAMLYVLSRNIIKEDNRIDMVKDKVKIKEKHTELVKYRFDIGMKISNILKDLIINLGANRAGVLEMHNGTNNLSGVPFVFADFNYEEVSQGEDYMGCEFKELNLTRYPFFSNRFDDGYWFGSIEDMKNEDNKFYNILKIANCGYLCGINLYGNRNIIGYMFITFANGVTVPDRDEIMIKLNEASQKISAMLDKSYGMDV